MKVKVKFSKSKASDYNLDDKLFHAIFITKGNPQGHAPGLNKVNLWSAKLITDKDFKEESEDPEVLSSKLFKPGESRKAAEYYADAINKVDEDWKNSK